MKDKVLLHLDDHYLKFLDEIKLRLRKAQLTTAIAVNSHLVIFYWQLGRDILSIQRSQNHWGTRLLQQLSQDLQAANPGTAGFSKRSLEYMRLLASLYPDEQQFTQQPAAQLPWSHIQLLLDKFKKNLQKLQWYAKEGLSNGWSRSALNMQIKSNLYERQSLEAVKIANYKEILAAPQSDLAHEMLKSPYNFDFLTIGSNAQEREIEKALVKHIRDFLLELG